MIMGIQPSLYCIFCGSICDDSGSYIKMIYIFYNNYVNQG